MSLFELLLRLKPAQSPKVFIKDKASYRVPELTGTHQCKPIEIANILQHTAVTLINDPNSDLNPRYMMREILLMDEMYRLFEDLPEGEHTEADGQIKLSRGGNGIAVTYEDTNKDPYKNPRRKISVSWFRKGKEGRFTDCHVFDQFASNEKLISTVETGYESFGDTGRYGYRMEMRERSVSNSVDTITHRHKGIYSHDGTPFSVPQSWSLCSFRQNVKTGSLPSSTLNNS